MKIVEKKNKMRPSPDHMFPTCRNTLFSVYFPFRVRRACVRRFLCLCVGLFIPFYCVCLASMELRRLLYCATTVKLFMSMVGFGFSNPHGICSIRFFTWLCIACQEVWNQFVLWLCIHSTAQLSRSRASAHALVYCSIALLSAQITALCETLWLRVGCSHTCSVVP